MFVGRHESRGPVVPPLTPLPVVVHYFAKKGSP
jgi:hypothetical protein